MSDSTVFPLSFPATFEDTGDFAVETVVRLLTTEPDSTWTHGAVEVFQWQETDAKGRQGIDRGLFVWSPAETSLDRFSADGDHLDQGDTVEIVIGTYGETETARLIEDVIDVMGQYIDDNHQNVNFRTVEPSAATDDRANTILRKTDHYTGTVTVNLENLRPTGP